MNERALRRVMAELPPETLDALTGLPGADLTTVMLEMARRRADALDPADVLRRYRADRFVGPGQIDPRAIRAVEDQLFGALPYGFVQIVLSPLIPFGTHGVGGIAQSRVVTTIRSTEVAADPTNGLALEAAVRRGALLEGEGRSAEAVHLAASQRVVRAQAFEGDASFSHFQLFGLVSAGRDTGNLAFERATVVEHMRFAVEGIRRVTGAGAVVALTDLTGGRMARVIHEVETAFVGDPSVDVREDPDRDAGRGYYDRLCFKVHAVHDSETFEIADGGLVDWTQTLMGNRKERLMISGLGVERLAIFSGIQT